MTTPLLVVRHYRPEWKTFVEEYRAAIVKQGRWEGTVAVTRPKIVA